MPSPRSRSPCLRTPRPRPSPAALAACVGSGVRRPALAVAIGIGVTASWWFTEGRYIESTDNAYIQGDIAVLSPRIEGDVTAIKVADNQRGACRRSPDRAGSGGLARPPRPGHRRRRRGHGRDRDGAAAGRPNSGPRSMRPRPPSSRPRPSRRGRPPMPPDPDRWWQAAGRRASPTTRRSPTQRKANAAVVATQAQKVAAEQQLAVLNAQVVQARARQQNAAAAVQLAENNLAYTVIRAPFDGIAGNRAAELGQHVTPATQLIAVAPLRERLYVVANFKETQLRRMQPGMKVRLIPDIDSSAAVDGRVDSLAPATGALFSLLPPENATGNFTKVVQRVPVKLVLDPAEAAHAGWLRAGLSVTAEVDTRGPDAQRLGLFGTAAATLERIVP